MEATSSSETPVPVCQEDGHRVVACSHQYNSGINPQATGLNFSCHLITLNGRATIVVVGRLRVKGARDTTDHYRATAGTSTGERLELLRHASINCTGISDRRTERDTKQNTNRARCKRVTHTRVCLSVCPSRGATIILKWRVNFISLRAAFLKLFSSGGHFH